jgi:putative oxidoreductase
MADLNSFSYRWSPHLLGILRIVAALLFMEHGGQKLLGIPPSPQAGTLSLLSMAGVSGILEFFGGLLLLLGLFTRPVAFILSGEMAVAYFIVHAPRGFWPLLNDGEKAVLYCFVFLYLAAAGGGPWSVDHLWRRGDTSLSSETV